MLPEIKPNCCFAPYLNSVLRCYWFVGISFFVKSPKLGSIAPDMVIFLVMDTACKCKCVIS